MTDHDRNTPRLTRREAFGTGLAMVTVGGLGRGFPADGAWNGDQIKVVVKLEGRGRTQAAAFSRDGTQIAVGGIGKDTQAPSWIVLRNVADWKETGATAVPKLRIHDLNWTPDGRDVLVTAWDEYRVVQLDVKTLATRDVIAGPAGAGMRLVPMFSPDGTYMLSCNPDEGVAIRDAKTFEVVHILAGTRDQPWDFQPSSAKPWKNQQGGAVTMSPQGIAYVMSPMTFMPRDAFVKPGQRYAGPPGFKLQRIRGIDPCWAANHLITSSDYAMAAFVARGEGPKTCRVEVYDIKSGEVWRKLHAFDAGDNFDNIYCLAFSPDGSTLVAGCADTVIRRWDVRKGRALKDLVGHEGAIWTIHFSPDGRLMASAGMQDDRVLIWSP